MASQQNNKMLSTHQDDAPVTGNPAQNDTVMLDASQGAASSAETAIPTAETAGPSLSSSEHRGYDYKGCPKPSENDDVPMYPGINHNANESLENAFKNNFADMMDMFDKGDSEAAEAIATELLLWGNLPCLIRTYAHIVLAYGPTDNLLHASGAVEEAQWGLAKYDDQGVGNELLSVAKQTFEEVTKARSEPTNAGSTKVDTEQGKQKDDNEFGRTEEK